MDWNCNLRNLVSRPGGGPDSSFNFLYNYNNYDQYPGVDLKHQTMAEAAFPGMEKISYGMNAQERKKRLTSDQLDSLERSFQEEIKLDPDRKMKLSRELGLQPRQIAVWFQNRRARWKAKQLEHLYDALKQEFDVVTKEKQKLQEEVMKLKAMLRDEATRKPMSTGYTDISGEETVESTSVALRSSVKPPRGNGHHHHHPIAECNYLLSVDECNPVPSPYWALPVLPSYPS